MRRLAVLLVLLVSGCGCAGLFPRGGRISSHTGSARLAVTAAATRST
jgi:hypothetical protein